MGHPFNDPDSQDWPGQAMRRQGPMYPANRYASYLQNGGSADTAPGYLGAMQQRYAQRAAPPRGQGGGMSTAPPNVGGAATAPPAGPYQYPATAGTPGNVYDNIAWGMRASPYAQNPNWWYSPRVNNTGSAYAGDPAHPSQLSYQKYDPSIAKPAWQQMGFMDERQWRDRGSPLEMGLDMPSLTDPATGIYHSELYTPEYEKAYLQSQNSNYRSNPGGRWHAEPIAGSGHVGPNGLTWDYTEEPAWQRMGFGNKFGWRSSGMPSQYPPLPTADTPGFGPAPMPPAGAPMPGAAPLWQTGGFGSRQDWRAAGKPGRTP